MPIAYSNGIRIHYEVEGRGEPLVLITGLGGGRTAWFLQRRAYRKHFRIVMFDSRGVGSSDRPTDPFTTRTMADDTVGLMDHLGIERAHVLGVSLGGMIAQEIAINYPARVMKLILACTSPGRSSDSREPSDIVQRLGLPYDDRGDVEADKLDFAMVRDSMGRLSFNGRFWRWAVGPMAGLYTRRVGGDEAKGQFEAAVRHRALDRLHLIEAPTLIIAGGDDRLIPPRFSEEMAGRIPHSTLVVIEGGSHNLLAEKRGRFNREVLQFLTSV